MKYYFSGWDKTRGDNNDKWGASAYFLELDDNNYVLRQIERYKNGNSLKYKKGKMLEDNYGMLTDQQIHSTVIVDNNFKKITKELFEETWQASGVIDGLKQWK